MPVTIRFLTAQRQIGSLVKPAIYLTALQKQKYTLGSRISDAPVTVKLVTRKYWQPANYDRRNMGYITVLKALLTRVITLQYGLVWMWAWKM